MPGKMVTVQHNRKGSVIVKIDDATPARIAMSSDVSSNILVEIKEEDRFLKKVYSRARNILTRGQG